MDERHGNLAEYHTCGTFDKLALHEKRLIVVIHHGAGAETWVAWRRITSIEPVI